MDQLYQDFGTLQKLLHGRFAIPKNIRNMQALRRFMGKEDNTECTYMIFMAENKYRISRLPGVSMDFVNFLAQRFLMCTISSISQLKSMINEIFSVLTFLMGENVADYTLIDQNDIVAF